MRYYFKPAVLFIIFTTCLSFKSFADNKITDQTADTRCPAGYYPSQSIPGKCLKPGTFDIPSCPFGQYATDLPQGGKCVQAKSTQECQANSKARTSPVKIGPVDLSDTGALYLNKQCMTKTDAEQFCKNQSLKLINASDPNGASCG